jgi:hypothetical protein
VTAGQSSGTSARISISRLVEYKAKEKNREGGVKGEEVLAKTTEMTETQLG